MPAHSLSMPTPDQALPGRSTPMPVPERHRVLGHPLRGPFPAGLQQAVFGMGCFWAPSGASGSYPASGPPPWAMPAA